LKYLSETALEILQSDAKLQYHNVKTVHGMQICENSIFHNIETVYESEKL
jgi:hypothetical protein